MDDSIINPTPKRRGNPSRDAVTGCFIPGKRDYTKELNRLIKFLLTNDDQSKLLWNVMLTFRGNDYGAYINAVRTAIQRDEEWRAKEQAKKDEEWREQTFQVQPSRHVAYAEDAGKETVEVLAEVVDIRYQLVEEVG